MPENDPDLIWLPLTEEQFRQLTDGKTLRILVPADAVVNVTGAPIRPVRDTVVMIRPPSDTGRPKITRVMS